MIESPSVERSYTESDAVDGVDRVLRHSHNFYECRTDMLL